MSRVALAHLLRAPSVFGFYLSSPCIPSGVGYSKEAWICAPHPPVHSGAIGETLRLFKFVSELKFLLQGHSSAPLDQLLQNLNKRRSLDGLPVHPYGPRHIPPTFRCHGEPSKRHFSYSNLHENATFSFKCRSSAPLGQTLADLIERRCRKGFPVGQSGPLHTSTTLRSIREPLRTPFSHSNSRQNSASRFKVSL